MSPTTKKVLAVNVAVRPVNSRYPCCNHGRPLQRGQVWQILRDAA
ncbi:MAG: hypothetical protein OWU84_03785 [Firmicutes bacterium]|nr:hypothetical protein [Bacillota bacterium]